MTDRPLAVPAHRPARRTVLRAGALAAATVALHVPDALAQAAYPNRPIRIIVPFATGGAADLVARAIADQFARRLGQSVVVENRTGASGNIGTAAVASAEPDGYTLVLGFDGTFVINPHIFDKLPFDPVADFAPVGKIGDVPLLVLANPQVGVRTLAELVALSKTRPGGLSYGTAGTGSTQHLMFELLNLRTGSKFVHVPYKGAAPAMTDVMGGHIPLAGAALAGSLDFVRTGKLVAIAISSARRSTFLPEVPTLEESGVRDLTINAWHGILAPAKTPRAIVERLNATLDAALRDPDVVERLAKLGSIAAPGSPEDFGRQIVADIARYREPVRVAGIKAD